MIQTILRPIITEKSLSKVSHGWYTFAVDFTSSKPVIAKAIGDFYKVDVTDIRTMIMHGKERRAGRKMKRVRRSDWKKALVRLKEGQKIDSFETAPEGEKKS